MSSIFNPSLWDPRLIGLAGAICAILILFRCYEVFCRSPSVRRRRRTLSGNSNRMRLNEQVDDISSQFHSRGLSSYVMDSLPITQIKKTANITGEEPKQSDVVECAVCLGEFEEDEWVKHLPVCSHVFHVSCIDTWFQTHSSCPLCRSFVDTSIDSTRQLSVSRDLFLETLDREDFHRQRSEGHQDFRFQILQNEVSRGMVDEESRRPAANISYFL